MAIPDDSPMKRLNLWMIVFVFATGVNTGVWAMVLIGELMLRWR